MRLIGPTTWENVFEGWRAREAHNPGWIRCATETKGWPDWESWRRFSASQIGADVRSWQRYAFIDPMYEIPKMLLGPYVGWQSGLEKKNTTSFEELLEVPAQYERFSQHTGILAIMKGLPFTTEFIGLVREDNGKIVCLEGHHRATAIALAKRHGTPIDFSGVNITIALADLPTSEIQLLDELLTRGSSKNPEPPASSL